MSGYIGAIPTPQATQSRDVYTATSNQTTFTTQGYTTNFASAYVNGVHLARADFTATNGSDVVLASGATADDVVEIISFGTFQSADALPLTGGTMTGDLIVPDGDLILGSTAVTSTAAELNKLDGVGTLKQAGKETIYVPAAAMYPNTTNGCADLAQVELSNGPEIKCLDFDASSDENAQFSIAFPKSWNEGTITFQAFFTVTGTNTGTVAWGLSGVGIADNASCNTAFGTNVVATAKAHSGTSNDLDVTAESGAVTIASAAVDTMTFFQIMRDVSADDQSGDARLLGVKLFFTTDAANDA